MTSITFGDRYDILWAGSSTDSALARVRNYATNALTHRDFPVLLDDRRMAAASMRLAFSLWDQDGPQIIVSSHFAALASKLRDPLLWHEIGHIHFDHDAFLQGEFANQEDLMNARIDALISGNVVSWELQADRFAISKVGKDAFVASLRFLRDTRPKGLPINDLGTQELDLRIKFAVSSS